MCSDNALARTIVAAAANAMGSEGGKGRAVDLLSGGLGFAGRDCVQEGDTVSNVTI